MVYLGVDLGGTGIKVGAVTEAGNILAKGAAPTLRERPYQEIIADIAVLCQKVVAQASLTMDDVAAIGVGVPGICNPHTGVIPFCTNLGWHEVPFVAELQKHIAKPVIVDNDATVAGFAESIAGVSAGSSSSVFLTLGTGVGGAIIINGKPFSGAHGVGSELGHMIIRMDGDPCNCGNAGCFERYASATAIIRMAKEILPRYSHSKMLARVKGDVSRINAKTVIDCAKEGDPAALEAFNLYVKGLATGIVSIVHVLDPEIVVLGGGVSMAGDFLLNAVRREIPKMVMYKTMPFARIELAKLGADAGIIGAAMLGK